MAEFQRAAFKFVYICLEQQLKQTPGNFLASQWLALEAMENDNSKQRATKLAPTPSAPIRLVPTPSARLPTPPVPIASVPAMSVPSTLVPTASVPITYHWQPPARPEPEAGPSTRQPLDQMDVDSDKGEQSVWKSMKRKRGGDDQPVKARGPVAGSGLYHSPACLQCVKGGGVQCEKQLKSGWVCVLGVGR